MKICAWSSGKKQSWLFFGESQAGPQKKNVTSEVEDIKAFISQNYYGVVIHFYYFFTSSEVEDIKPFTSQNIAKVNMKLKLLLGGNSLLLLLYFMWNRRHQSFHFSKYS